MVAERLSDGPSTSKYVVSIPTSEASLEGLGPNSSYRIFVSTVGMNTMRSQAVTLLCNTTVEGESLSFPQPCHRPQEKTPSVANYTWGLFQLPVSPMWSCTELQWVRALGRDAGTSHRLSNVWWVCGSRDTLTGCACWFLFQPCLHPCEQTSSRWRPAPRLSFHLTCSARRTARSSITVSLLPLMIHVSAPAYPICSGCLEGSRAP